MNNAEIAGIFLEIADILERDSESVFKVRAYRRAAESVAALSEDIGALLSRGELQTIPGVGEAIAKKITELVETGKLEFLDRLKNEIPGETDDRSG